MSGGKGKSHGGKTGGKGGAARDGRSQMSHSARAGLQVFLYSFKLIQFPVGRVRRFMKMRTQNK